MKQVVLDPRTGEVSLQEVPPPASAPDRLLVRSHVSIVSAGTESQLIGLSSKGVVGKARARPEAARQLVDTVLREGLRAAKWKAEARLDHPVALGYSLAGRVLEVGKHLDGPNPGDLVACGGGGMAVHAEVVSIPPLLAAKIPSGVADEDAAFANLGAIAMNAVRLANIGVGGGAVVVGLGLIGQLTAQILTASGCWVIGVDPDQSRRELAAQITGCETTSDAIGAISGAQKRGGADAVLVTAAGSGNEVMEAAIDMSRDRGQIVVVGSVPISVDRDRMYHKELSLVVARSSGPGRYERSYELEGVDLPVGHVRWTEGRNMMAFLELIHQGRVAPAKLITHRYPIDQAESAYELMKSRSEPFLALALAYDDPAKSVPAAELELAPRVSGKLDRPQIGAIGGGNFARSVLFPRLRRLNVGLRSIATASGASAAASGRRFGFRQASTDPTSVIRDPDVQGIVIATRHNLHATYAAQALDAGRHVYAEKPLALSREELSLVCEAWGRSGSILSVGFNRRFAPLLMKLRQRLTGSGPITAVYVVNVPQLSPDNWVLDPSEGGGVVMAEGGHFLDSLAFLTGSRPVSVWAIPIGQDSYQATVRFADDSVGTILYTTGARGAGPKEHVTVAGGGVLAQLHDFRRLTVWTKAGKEKLRTRAQDKGHQGALGAWVDSMVKGSPQPVDILDIVAVSEATICMDEALKTGKVEGVGLARYVDALGPLASG